MDFDLKMHKFDIIFIKNSCVKFNLFSRWNCSFIFPLKGAAITKILKELTKNSCYCKFNNENELGKLAKSVLRYYRQMPFWTYFYVKHYLSFKHCY